MTALSKNHERMSLFFPPKSKTIFEIPPKERPPILPTIDGSTLKKLMQQKQTQSKQKKGEVVPSLKKPSAFEKKPVIPSKAKAIPTCIIKKGTAPSSKKFNRGKRQRVSSSSGTDGGMSDPSDCIRGQNGEDWEGHSGQWTSTDSGTEESEEESEKKLKKPQKKRGLLEPSEEVSTNSSS